MVATIAGASHNNGKRIPSSSRHRRQVSSSSSSNGSNNSRRQRRKRQRTTSWNSPRRRNHVSNNQHCNYLVTIVFAAAVWSTSYYTVSQWMQQQQGWYASYDYYNSFFNTAASADPIAVTEAWQSQEILQRLQLLLKLPPEVLPLPVPPDEQDLDSSTRNIPIVLISSARPNYLQQTLESLQNQNQNPNTPAWIQHSPRHLFVHWHNRNNHNTSRLHAVQDLAQHYNVSLHLFEGLHSVKQRRSHVPQEFVQEESQQNMAYFAKMAWYDEMHYLFHHLDIHEALILEEDAVLAYDGLLTAAALFQEKWRRERLLVDSWHQSNNNSNNDNNTNHINAANNTNQPPPRAHAICLGAWSGENRIQAHADTLSAVQSHYFQAMAYSMDKQIFTHLETQFDAIPLDQLLRQHRNDWTEDITMAALLQELIMLTPTVGRMQHVGQVGMGQMGDGSIRRDIAPKHWEPWNATIYNKSRNWQDYRLDPPDDMVVTDTLGFTCQPQHSYCHGMLDLVPSPRLGNDALFAKSRESADYYPLLTSKHRQAVLARRRRADELQKRLHQKRMAAMSKK